MLAHFLFGLCLSFFILPFEISMVTQFFYNSFFIIESKRLFICLFAYVSCFKHIIATLVLVQAALIFYSRWYVLFVINRRQFYWFNLMMMILGPVSRMRFILDRIISTHFIGLLFISSIQMVRQITHFPFEWCHLYYTATRCRIEKPTKNIEDSPETKICTAFSVDY